MPKILLEICAGSVEDCRTAATANADRIELNSALAVGGLTPSLGALIEAKRLVDVPIIAMVRPRPGGFCYRAAEFSTMQRDVELLLDHGADGITFGILHEDGAIDIERCRALINQAKPRQVVFHRAFDVVPNPFEALETLIDLGVNRILTSGQAPTALDGSQTISLLHEKSYGRIEILPGCGINLASVADLLDRTGCDQVHASLSGFQADTSMSANPVISFNAVTLPSDDRFVATELEAVVAMRQLLDSR